MLTLLFYQLEAEYLLLQLLFLLQGTSMQSPLEEPCPQHQIFLPILNYLSLQQSRLSNTAACLFSLTFFYNTPPLPLGLSTFFRTQTLEHQIFLVGGSIRRVFLIFYCTTFHLHTYPNHKNRAFERQLL